MLWAGFYSGTGGEGKGMVEVSQGKPVWALGLMSGTSMDGVDAALVLTDGETVSEFGAVHSLPLHGVELGFLPLVHRRWQDYRPPRNEALAGELAAAGGTVDNLHISAAGALLERSGSGAAVIGYHGQTVAHAPDEGWTWQLGDGDALAKALHVSRQTVNAIERGKYDPSLPLAFRIAVLFARHVEEVFIAD